MSIFNRKSNENDMNMIEYPHYPPYSDFLSEPIKKNKNKYKFKNHIKFKKQLANGSLIFAIVDDDYDIAGGYIIVSSSGIVTLIKDNFYELSDSICKYLKKQAKTFYDATIATTD